MSDLFPESFMAMLGGLSLDCRQASPSSTPGAYLSRTSGSSLDFRDFQEYTPGDDPRRVDWNMYRRSGKLFVRRFERPVRVPIYLMIDGSGSMRLETPSRFVTAARVAVAIAAAAIKSQNPVHFHLSGSSRPLASVEGRGGLVRLMGALTEERAGTSPGPASFFDPVVTAVQRGRRGVLFLISDLFDARGVDPVMDQLRALPHKLQVLQVTQPWDENPEVDGDVQMEDCESGARVLVSANAAAVAAYRERYANYFRPLLGFCASRGVALRQLDASGRIEDQLARLFPDGGVLRL